jgi:hypothetical protein
MRTIQLYLEGKSILHLINVCPQVIIG